MFKLKIIVPALVGGGPLPPWRRAAARFAQAKPTIGIAMADQVLGALDRRTATISSRC